MKIVEYQLADLLITLENGGRPSGGVSSITNGVPSVGGEHLTYDGGFDFSKVKYIPIEYFNKMRRGHIQNDDVLVVKDGATTGKVSFVANNFPFKQAAVNEHVFILRTDQKKVIPKFLFYFLYSPIGQERMLANYRGAAIGGINQSFAQNTIIPLPPLPEQERIVYLLDEADALRKLRSQADARMEEFVPALFHEMFGDVTELSSMKWDFQNVGSFADVSYGLADKLSSETSPDDGTRIITISNVTLDGKLDLSVEKYSLAGDKDKAKASLQKFDMLFNWRNGSEQHVGKTALWEDNLLGEILHVSFLLKIRPDLDKVDPYYLLVLFNRLRKTGFFVKQSRFQINTKFNASEVSALRLPIPPLDLQREFSQRVQETREVQSVRAQSAGRVEALYQSMLDRAFAGEL